MGGLPPIEQQPVDPGRRVGKVERGDDLGTQHCQVGQALAEGPGVNPFGDETLERISPWWTEGPCVP